MNIEKMREEFEAWAKGRRMRLSRDGVVVDYANSHTDLAWNAWQASRAALVVELPIDVTGGHYRLAVESCKRCIEAAGVKVKS